MWHRSQPPLDDFGNLREELGIGDRSLDEEKFYLRKYLCNVG
jgi:hypothetical protein